MRGAPGACVDAVVGCWGRSAAGVTVDEQIAVFAIQKFHRCGKSCLGEFACLPRSLMTGRTKKARKAAGQKGKSADGEDEPNDHDERKNKSALIGCTCLSCLGVPREGQWLV